MLKYFYLGYRKNLFVNPYSKKVKKYCKLKRYFKFSLVMLPAFDFACVYTLPYTYKAQRKLQSTQLGHGKIRVANRSGESVARTNSQAH